MGWGDARRRAALREVAATGGVVGWAQQTAYVPTPPPPLAKRHAWEHLAARIPGMAGPIPSVGDAHSTRPR